MDDDTEVFERRMRFRSRVLHAAEARGYALVQRTLPDGELVWCWANGDRSIDKGFVTKLEAMRSMRDVLRSEIHHPGLVQPG